MKGNLKRAFCKGWGYTSVGECLPSMDEAALGLIPSTEKNQKKAFCYCFQFFQ
jgi:hypothetical protein